MRAAWRAEALGDAFQHDALGDAMAAQEQKLVCVQRAGVGVGEQAGLIQDQPAHRGLVVDGGGMAQSVQRLAGSAVAQFRLFAEGEQRLGAAGGSAGAG